MIVDFHNHSSASDGELSPLDLVNRASEKGVELMAITDHDSIDGYLAVKKQFSSPACDTLPIRLIAGVELSCTWKKMLIHIVGLNFDPYDIGLQKELEGQQQARLDRARLIGEKLEKFGFNGAFEYASKLAGESQIGRPHFARFLLDKGYVSSVSHAFKKYLGAGKPGDIKLTWPKMASAIQWIVASGGVAVLAHPLHYKMTATKLRLLVSDFKLEGGEAIEVISGQQSKDRTQYLSQLAQRFELKASTGSDFHRPGNSWSELGQQGILPNTCEPIWKAFSQ